LRRGIKIKRRKKLLKYEKENEIRGGFGSEGIK
jgi:hypothetical protein